MQKKINNPLREITILVAPLDWGLGHTTRCIPIIRQLKTAGVKVIAAGNASAEKILKEAFPGLDFLPLDGYEIRYGKSKWSLLPILLKQLPKLITKTKLEKAWLEKMIDLHQLDAVISDNRFGLSSHKVPCIYITHQLYIETGITLFNRLAQKIHYSYLNKFSACWVPDSSETPGLAGKLSHPLVKPNIPLHYPGPLSRMKAIKPAAGADLLILVSGPEPQRTIFEEMMISLVKQEKGKILFVRGLPAAKEELKATGNISFVNHLPAAELATEITSCKFLVARSGYSTIMDLVALQKTALLIPTPGQGEQEYLARHLSSQGWFTTAKQEVNAIRIALKQQPHLNTSVPGFKDNSAEVVNNFIDELR